MASVGLEWGQTLGPDEKKEWLDRVTDLEITVNSTCAPGCAALNGVLVRVHVLPCRETF